MHQAPWVQKHPATAIPDLLNFCIPLRSHGDDASIKTLHNRRLCILSVHSESACQNSLISRLLNFVIPDDLLIPGESLPALMAAWVWSWVCCLLGEHPVVDHNNFNFPEGSQRHARRGERLSGPYFFAWCGALGDWSWHSKFWYPFVHGSSHNFICSRDLASRALARLRFDDHRPEAGPPWRSPFASHLQQDYANDIYPYPPARAGKQYGG